MAQHYYWKTICKDIQASIKNYELCNWRSNMNNCQPKKKKTRNYPFEYISLDSGSFTFTNQLGEARQEHFVLGIDH